MKKICANCMSYCRYFDYEDFGLCRNHESNRYLEDVKDGDTCKKQRLNNNNNNNLKYDGFNT